jgi:hypothetical protein
VEAHLWDLCVIFGYCLSPEKQDELVAVPPQDITPTRLTR